MPSQSKRSFSLKLFITTSVILTVTAVIIYLRTSSVNRMANDVMVDTGEFKIPTEENIQTGKLLASHYCASCHMLPDPSLLNREKWKTLLPQMGLRLGIRNFRGYDYTIAVKAPELYVPSKQLLTDEQWADIIDYYANTAPIALAPQNRRVPIVCRMPYFAMVAPSVRFSSGKALGCMVRIDTTCRPVRIFIADGRKKELFLLNNKLQLIDSVGTADPVVDMLFNADRTLICTIGRELGANSDRFGAVNELTISKAGKLAITRQALFTKLARPVKVLAADLDNDGKTDYVICEFGNINGELCWMQNVGRGNFIKRTLRPVPGAIDACFDFSRNKNAPDLWVLFAQGDEGIYHFINNGKGAFEQRRVLRFPPIYGSSSFQMVDMNNDGYKDIIYTCGDNGDATLVKKPYHGVYVFLNDKHGYFNQIFFYPINGCYKAFARDFDGDGKIDIATISLFTDARQPYEGFVFLKNLGGLDFRPFALPDGTKFERGITMDAGDINGDGKTDLLVGNAFFNTGPFKNNQKEPLFFVLRNISK